MKKYPEEFERVREIIRTDYELHATKLDRIPDSLKGVWALFYSGVHRGYFTVRPEGLDENATKEWLGRDTLDFRSSDQEQPSEEKFYPYPDHTRVVRCDSHEDKILKILADETDNNDPKALIDDNPKALAQAARKIHNEHPELRDKLKSLILIGFETPENETESIEEFLTDTGVNYVQLPSWKNEEVNTMLHQLQNLTETPSTP